MISKACLTNGPSLKLGWHKCWLIPVSLLAILNPERYLIASGFTLLSLCYQRWVWAALISPCTYLFLSITIGSFFLPIQCLQVLVVVLKSRREIERRAYHFYVLTLLLVIFLCPLLISALQWGTFPFIIDTQDVHRLRMIPFIPWPGRYGEY